jgi:hypothetical protein
MSAYKKIKCELVNQNILLQALHALGFNPAVYKNATKLVGYEGKAREQTAEIVISRSQLNSAFTGASNDLGFKWNDKENKYDMICSDYDVYNKIPQRIKQAYAKIAIETALKEKKFNIQHVTPNNQLQKRTRNRVEIRATKIF